MNEENTLHAEDMKLRDYFAGQALISLGGIVCDTFQEPKVIAQSCYDIADAMMEARK